MHSHSRFKKSTEWRKKYPPKAYFNLRILRIKKERSEKIPERIKGAIYKRFGMRMTSDFNGNIGSYKNIEQCLYNSEKNNFQIDCYPQFSIYQVWGKNKDTFSHAKSQGKNVPPTHFLKEANWECFKIKE